MTFSPADEFQKTLSPHLQGVGSSGNDQWVIQGLGFVYRKHPTISLPCFVTGFYMIMVQQHIIPMSLSSLSHTMNESKWLYIPSPPAEPRYGEPYTVTEPINRSARNKMTRCEISSEATGS